jgi:hypothetical protein
MELLNIEDPMRLMQKTFLFPVQIGLPLAKKNHTVITQKEQQIFVLL